MRRTVLIVALIVGIGGGWLAWYILHRSSGTDGLMLYGNVDLRNIELAFNNNERLTDVMVQEGDRVRKGQLLARLDTSRLEPQVAQAAAQTASQRALVERYHRGNRPEEIAQSRANLEAALADAANAQLQYQRLVNLSQSSSGRAVIQQDLDTAKATLDMASARLAVNRKSVELEIAGPRQEDVAQVEAQLRADEAQELLIRRQLADAQLFAPIDAVVRTRLLEPGEMVSAQRPVFSLAINDPKWIRAYVDEPNLGRVHPGMAASISSDSFPGQSYKGWVGFISSVAEFTPKDVQTEELRTSLVYEVRVFVHDPGDELRQGMPATVKLSQLESDEHQLPAQNVTAPMRSTPTGSP